MPHNYNFTMTTTPDPKIHCLFTPGTKVRFNYKRTTNNEINYKYPGESWQTIRASEEDSTLDYTTEYVDARVGIDLYRVDLEIAVNGRSYPAGHSLKGTPCDGAPLRRYPYPYFVWGEINASAEDGNDLNNGADLVQGFGCNAEGWRFVEGEVFILCRGILTAGHEKTELTSSELDVIRNETTDGLGIREEKELLSSEEEDPDEPLGQRTRPKTTLTLTVGGSGGVVQPEGKQSWNSKLQGISYYNTYSVKDGTTECKFTVTENGETIFKRTEKECPEVEIECMEQNEESIDINTVIPLLSGIEVKGSEVPVIPDHCIEIWRYIQGVPPTQMKVKRLCSGKGCPPPKYTVKCNPCCPPGLIEVECGDSICCYNNQGEAVKQCS